MPVDTTLPQTSALHGDGNTPYPCSKRANPPGGAGFIDYGLCRTSMDQFGRNDPRCPASCPHKADEETATGFGLQFTQFGAQAAAAWVRERMTT